MIRYPTLAKTAIARKKNKEAVSEELRVLYVAMTRAQDRLVMTYYSRYLDRELKNLCSQLTLPLSDELCAAAASPGYWVLLAALTRTEAGALFARSGPSPVSRVWPDAWRIEAVDLADSDAATGTGSLRDLTPPQPDPASLALLDYVYPHAAAAAIPAKLTATQLKGRVPDEEAAAGAVQPLPPSAFRRPSFLPRAMTAAERGVATHLFMQFARYEACTTAEAIEAERNRLLREEFLTAGQADAVRADQVLAFFTSALGQWLLGQKEVRREFKFSLLTDAARLGWDVPGEQVMLQGVVDCFAVEPDGLTILDFKTDWVDAASVAARAAHYAPQLNAYAEALGRIYRLPVKRKILYFFAISQAVEL